MKDYYIKTMSALLKDPKYQEQYDELLKELKATLKKHGHLKLLPTILRGVIKSLPTMSGGKPLLIVSSDSQSELNKQKTALKQLDLEIADLQVKVDPTIIGGFILKKNGRLFDYSYKSQLVTLYRQIVR